MFVTRFKNFKVKHAVDTEKCKDGKKLSDPWFTVKYWLPLPRLVVTNVKLLWQCVISVENLQKLYETLVTVRCHGIGLWVPPELGKHKNGKQHNGNSQNVKTKIQQIHKMSKPQNGKCIKRQNLKMAKPQNGKTQNENTQFFRIYRSLITVNYN